ncbi:ankyrin repeat protein [Legionella massiliensis]|uniref:Ankyrin repeat protein n=1 Tax=Legionella massiliensis TaxID=1034943 RepID=A0A078KU73_9GAMM|nr:ankyrin repeat domain-containing protein [Legionella massiliensis]CDZ76532.1 ankyrin repeat protein [Legionella massiliensis]CEE12270.1 Ankyrin repeats (3 copies) [Legionella massiliensis]
MLVRNIQEFIHNLELRTERLNSFDREHLHLLKSKYETRDGNEELTPEELTWIQQILAERCESISDSLYDYTFNISAAAEIRQAWIMLAKNLGATLEVPYLLLLIPTMRLSSNTDLSELITSFETGHLFLSHNNAPDSTRDLFTALEAARTSSEQEKTKKSRPITILELYRIRMKAASEAPLRALDGSVYASFWKYLQETKLPFLQDKGGFPGAALIDLKMICRAYSSIRVSRKPEDFEFFYLQIQQLMNTLSTFSTDDVHHLYGTTIQVQGRAYYLIDILLDCLSYSSDLDVKLKAVEQWQRQFLSQALDAAMTQGRLADMKRLIRYGAKFDVLNSSGKRALNLVSSPEVIDFIDYCEIKELFLAVTAGNLPRVQQLIQAGLDLFVRDQEGQTLLHVVNNPAIAELLIQHGLTLDQKDIKGNLPLHSAVMRSNLDVVKRFLQDKTALSQVQSINELGNTPLHIAAHQDFEPVSYRQSLTILSAAKKQRLNNLAIMKCLVDAGANPNAQNHFDFTPLHLAVSCCHGCFGEKRNVIKADYSHVKDKVDFLCRSGANPALETNSTKIIKTEGRYQNYCFNIFEESTALGILYLYGGQGPNIDQKNKIKTEIASILISYGAAVTIVDQQRLSLLHSCARHGDWQGLAYFIEKRLNADYQPAPNEVSPLHQLLYWQGSESCWASTEACLEELLEAGANPNIGVLWPIRINVDMPVEDLNDIEVNALFEKDNVISHQLKLQGEQVVPEKLRRNVLKAKWVECGRKPLAADVSLLPEEYAQMSPFVELCDEAIEYLRDYRTRVAQEQLRVGCSG